MFRYFVTSILVMVVGAIGIALLYNLFNSDGINLILPVAFTALAVSCVLYLVYRITNYLVK